MTAIDIQDRLAPSRIGQATAVEQSRAIAQVQAMVVVAQQCPRNVPRAIEDMRDSCRRKELADNAFYRYPKGGSVVSGPSIKLARELARVWGNIEYGVSELRRDDDYGQSELLAFAWDVQTNARNSSTVINPHKLYTGGGGRQLTELRDIYDNNANVGARRVREAIFAVLPTWFVEEAIELCNRTLSDGGGVPLARRIANAIEVFGNLGVTVPQLETKLGAPSAKWTDQDVAQLRVIRQSLMRGEIRKDEEFPPPRVTATEITGNGAGNGAGAPVVAQESRKPTQAGKPLLDKLADRLAALDLGSEEDVTALIHMVAGPAYSATTGEVRTVIEYLDDHLKQADGDAEAARSAIWEQYRAAAERAGNGEADHA